MTDGTSEFIAAPIQSQTISVRMPQTKAITLVVVDEINPGIEALGNSWLCLPSVFTSVCEIKMHCSHDHDDFSAEISGTEFNSEW